MEVCDKVVSKLASQKGKLLNKLGRVTLANIVLTDIPSYIIQINWFPQFACDRLDKNAFTQVGLAVLA